MTFCVFVGVAVVVDRRHRHRCSNVVYIYIYSVVVKVVVIVVIVYTFIRSSSSSKYSRSLAVRAGSGPYNLVRPRVHDGSGEEVMREEGAQITVEGKEINIYIYIPT